MNSFKVLWTVSANKDLEEIIEYISNDSIDVAIKQYEKIKKRSAELKSFPEKGRIIPELLKENIRTYRELIIEPWRLIYKVENRKVYVMAIIDGRRNIEDILLKRQLR